MKLVWGSISARIWDFEQNVTATLERGIQGEKQELDVHSLDHSGAQLCDVRRIRSARRNPSERRGRGAKERTEGDRSDRRTDGGPATDGAGTGAHKTEADGATMWLVVKRAGSRLNGLLTAADATATFFRLLSSDNQDFCRHGVDQVNC
eukprot:536127-Amphidinium_carterae.1